MTNTAKTKLLKAFEEFEKEILRIRQEQKRILEEMEKEFSWAEMQRIKKIIKNID